MSFAVSIPVQARKIVRLFNGEAADKALADCGGSANQLCSTWKKQRDVWRDRFWPGLSTR